MSKRTAIISVCVVLAATTWTTRALATEAVVVESSLQLFLDDARIADADGVSREIRTAQRCPENPVLVVDKPWEGTSMHYVASWRNPRTGLFRMWYLTYDGGAKIVPGETPRISTMCYAESQDGVRWRKPNVGLVDHAGSKDNNILFRPGAREFDSFSVIVRPDEPDPAKRYRIVIFQGALTEGEFAPGQQNYPLGHYVLYSPDGIHWTPDWERPVMPVRGDTGSLDRTSWAWDERGGKWLGFLKRYENGKRVRYQSESTDFVHWTLPERCLIPDDKDPADVHFYGHCGWWYQTQYVGLLEVFHTAADRVDLQLLSSRDGKNWDRVGDRSPFLPLGAPGAFDAFCVYYSGAQPIVVEDEIYFYYTGADAPHAQGSKLGGVGLATIKAGRFACMRAGSAAGQIRTRPLRLAGPNLVVNADAEGGMLRVELQRSDGTVIPGFERDACRPIKGDGLSEKVEWRGGSPVPRNTSVCVVFEMREARLFGFACR